METVEEIEFSALAFTRL